MDRQKKIAIIGATSAIAEHCARLWLVKQPCDLVLVGRDARRLERIAADLKMRSPLSDIRVIETGFLEPAAISATVGNIVQSGPVDLVLIAYGSLSDQTECQNNIQLCRDVLEINGVSPAVYAEAFAKYMEQANHGTLALIGSVAGDRGRKSNYVYGAAKGLLTRYVQGLQHRFAGTQVKVVLIKPGPTDTPMTAHLKAKGAQLAPVEAVARDIVDAMDKGKSIVYTPRKWLPIMRIIQHLPNTIFSRLNI